MRSFFRTFICLFFEVQLKIMSKTGIILVAKTEDEILTFDPVVLTPLLH